MSKNKVIISGPMAFPAVGVIVQNDQNGLIVKAGGRKRLMERGCVSTPNGLAQAMMSRSHESLVRSSKERKAGTTTLWG